jgi:hypothetical protein
MASAAASHPSILSQLIKRAHCFDIRNGVRSRDEQPWASPPQGKILRHGHDFPRSRAELSQLFFRPSGIKNQEALYSGWRRVRSTTTLSTRRPHDEAEDAQGGAQARNGTRAEQRRTQADFRHSKSARTRLFLFFSPLFLIVPSALHSRLLFRERENHFLSCLFFKFSFRVSSDFAVFLDMAPATIHDEAVCILARFANAVRFETSMRQMWEI